MFFVLFLVSNNKPFSIFRYCLLDTTLYVNFKKKKRTIIPKKCLKRN